MSINRIKMVFLGTILSVLILAPVSALGQDDGDPASTPGGLPTIGTVVPGGEVRLTPGGTVGLFCEVEKVDVCVMTQTEGDCTKLGGEKVDSCSMAEKAEDKK